MRTPACPSTLQVVLAAMFSAAAVAALVPSGSASGGGELLARTAQALLRCASFLRSNPESVTKQHALGAAVVLGQVNGTISLFEDKCGSERGACAELLRLSRKLVADFSAIRDQFVDRAAHGADYTVRLLQPGLWSVPDTPAPTIPQPRLSCVIPTATLDVLELAVEVSGTPSERMSEECIRSLVVERCPPPTRACVLAETAESTPAIGYAATHRLLFQLIASRFGCRSEAVGDPDVTYRLCSQILQESREIECHGFPPPLRDLFAEQVALCGVAGFREFSTPAWVDAILSWQAPEGCFGDFEAAQKAFKHLAWPSEDRLARTACQSHLSATAAAALAVSLRTLAEQPAY